MNKLYKVGIYCRLSVDDASNSAKARNYIPADESVSIENQENICQGGFHPKDEIPYKLEFVNESLYNAT